MFLKHKDYLPIGVCSSLGSIALSFCYLIKICEQIQTLDFELSSVHVYSPMIRRNVYT